MDMEGKPESFPLNGPPLPLQLFSRELGLVDPNFSSRNVSSHADYCFTRKRTFDKKKLEVPPSARTTFHMAFSSDGELVASCHGDHNVYVCRVKDGKIVQQLTGHPRTPWCVVFHPTQSDILASGCLAGHVRVWDLKGGSELLTTDTGTVIASLSFHPFVRLLAIGTFNEVIFWDWRKSQVAKRCSTESSKEKVRLVKFDVSGRNLITGITNYPHPPEMLSRQSARLPSDDDDDFDEDEVAEVLTERQDRFQESYRQLVSHYEDLVQHYQTFLRTRVGQAIEGDGPDQDPGDVESEGSGNSNEGLTEPSTSTPSTSSSSLDMLMPGTSREASTQSQQPAGQVLLSQIPVSDFFSRLSSQWPGRNLINSQRQAQATSRISNLPSGQTESLVNIPRPSSSSSSNEAPTPGPSGTQVPRFTSIEALAQNILQMQHLCTQARRDAPLSNIEDQHILELQQIREHLEVLQEQTRRLQSSIRATLTSLASGSLAALRNLRSQDAVQSSVPRAEPSNLSLMLVPPSLRFYSDDPTSLELWPGYMNGRRLRNYRLIDADDARGRVLVPSASTLHQRGRVFRRRNLVIAGLSRIYYVRINGEMIPVYGRGVATNEVRTVREQANVVYLPAHVFELTRASNNEPNEVSVFGIDYGTELNYDCEITYGENNVTLRARNGHRLVLNFDARNLLQGQVRANLRTVLHTIEKNFNRRTITHAPDSRIQGSSGGRSQRIRNERILLRRDYFHDGHSSRRVINLAVDAAAAEILNRDVVESRIERVLNEDLRFDEIQRRIGFLSRWNSTTRQNYEDNSARTQVITLHFQQRFGDGGQGGPREELLVGRGRVSTPSFTTSLDVNGPFLSSRIQIWDFSEFIVPNIADRNANLVVNECSLHSDSCLDISADSQTLAVLQPSTTGLYSSLGLYSLKPGSIGDLITSYAFDQNTVSVSMAPSGHYLLVGFAGRGPLRVNMSNPNPKRVIGQILQIIPEENCLKLVRDLELENTNGMMAINCMSYLPVSGMGIVYGTNMGEVVRVN